MPEPVKAVAHDLGGGRYEINADSDMRKTATQWFESIAADVCGGSYIIEEKTRKRDSIGEPWVSGVVRCEATTGAEAKLDAGVKSAQAKLAELGYSPGAADGFMGTNT